VKLEGRYTIRAPRALVWNLLVDAETLARAIPGCERLERVDATHFDVALKVGIAAIKGTYRGTATIEDAHPPDLLTLVVDGKGTGGFVHGRGRIVLSEEEDGTGLAVEGDSQVGGLLASVGQRLILVGARMLMNDFFQAIDREAQAQAKGG
jgi:carbon monoxide dehydrogenase subunit G